MDLRDRIIQSAYELFSTKGYEKTTIGEIIKKAECSKGGFYHHFKSKDEILQVITSKYIADLSIYFKQIVSNDNKSFIDQFNSIFVSITNYKLKQLEEWTNVNNVFAFSGNEKILRQLDKEFKMATTKVYYQLIIKAKEQRCLNVQYSHILSELCTRQILWIYERASKIIDSNDDEEYKDLLDFSEEIISYSLGVKKSEIKFKEIAILYLNKIKEYYFTNKEE